MKVIVHQMLCGEVSKAWGLLSSTLPDVNEAKSLAFKTDLHDQSPTGISWLPATRGFVAGKYYLLIRTFPDDSPDVRPGRAFSHVLIIELVTICGINNLLPFLDLLPNHIDKSREILPVEVDFGESDKNIALSSDGRFNKVISGIVNLSSFTNTIVWVGQKNYENALIKFWSLLSPQEREISNFGIYFNTSQLSGDRINFITIPEVLEIKFANNNYCIIKTTENYELTEFSEKFLAGDIGVSSKIEGFLKAIGSSVQNRSEITNIAKVIDTFENIDSEIDIKKVNTLSQIVAQYAPKVTEATEIKNKIIKRLQQLIIDANSNEIFILRNFKTVAYKQSQSIIISSVKKWLNDNVYSFEANNSIDFSKFIVNVFQIKDNWLTKSICESVKGYLEDLNEIKLSILFHWIQADTVVLNVIEPFVAKKDNEDIFIENCPKLVSKNARTALKVFALKYKWLKFHATLLVQEFDRHAALILQLKVDDKQDFYDAIQIILSGEDDNSVVSYALDIGDERLINIASTLCVANNSLLNSLDVTNGRWQDIWSLSIEKGNKLEDGIINPLSTIESFFDEMVSGTVVNIVLLSKIAKSKFANILDYKQRNELWNVLPSNVKDDFLIATAASLLQSLSLDSNFSVPQDSILSSYILTSNAIGDFLYYNRHAIKSVLPIFITFHHIPESVVKDYIRNYGNDIDFVSSSELGRLVFRMNFHTVAQEIYVKTSRFPGFIHALVECHTLLNVFQQFNLILTGKLNNVTISSDQWWAAFTEQAIRLYSGGPADNKIWMEADGEEYDLLTNGTGKELWIDAINQLRRGRAKGITIDKLLKKMIKDHPKNPELKTLRDLKEKI